jgi:hypothetical protein
MVIDYLKLKSSFSFPIGDELNDFMDSSEEITALLSIRSSDGVISPKGVLLMPDSSIFTYQLDHCNYTGSYINLRDMGSFELLHDAINSSLPSLEVKLDVEKGSFRKTLK